MIGLGLGIGIGLGLGLGLDNELLLWNKSFGEKDVLAAHIVRMYLI